MFSDASRSDAGISYARSGRINTGYAEHSRVRVCAVDRISRDIVAQLGRALFTAVAGREKNVCSGSLQRSDALIERMIEIIAVIADMAHGKVFAGMINTPAVTNHD